LTADVHRACRDLGIAVLGGHSEVVATLDQPILSLTALGQAAREAIVTSSGARPGDEIILTKAAAIEGSALLATDFADELTRALGADLVAEAQSYWSEISVVPEGLVAAAAGASAMHDVTEGGILSALVEIADASGVGVRVRTDDIPCRPPTDAICRHFALDPLALVSSGALLLAAPRGSRVIAKLAAAGIAATAIGDVVDGPSHLLVGGQSKPLVAPPRDELWRLLDERAGR
jgi:hydrogenase maturation factor